MTDDPGAFTVGDLVGFCLRCERQLNRHGECINLFCQQQEASAEMVARCLSVLQAPCRECGSLLNHAPECNAPSTRAHVDPRVANPVRRRPFAMGTEAARRLVVWIVMGQAWSAWQRWGLVPEA